MPPLDLARTAVGDRVQHEFLVLERHEKRQATGDPFVVLALGNASGRISTAPVWANQMDWVSGAEKGRVVQVIGEVTSYRSRRQLQLTAPLRVLPSGSVQPELFLPRIAVATEQLWDWVDRARADLRSAALRRAVDLFFADDSFRVAFELVPASVDGHHAVLGGLLLHVTEVATIARNTSRVMKANADLAVVGALLHDVGKVQGLVTTPTGFEETSAGQLMGHPVLGALMLQERLAGVSPNELSPSQRVELHHLILSQRGLGESRGTVRPMTVEAEIVRLADESSANANLLSESLTDDAAFGDGELIEAGSGSVARRVWRRPHVWE
jgi:3'-5' exoribonuclease